MFDVDLDQYNPKPFIHTMYLEVIDMRLRMEGVALYKHAKDDIDSLLESSSWKRSVIDIWTEWNPEYVAKIKQKMGEEINLWTMLEKWEGQYCGCTSLSGPTPLHLREEGHWRTCPEVPWQQLIKANIDKHQKEWEQTILDKIDIKHERIKVRFVKLTQNCKFWHVVCDKTDVILSQYGDKLEKTKEHYPDLIWCAIYLYGDPKKGLSLNGLKHHIYISDGDREFLDAVRSGVDNKQIKKTKGFYKNA